MNVGGPNRREMDHLVQEIKETLKLGGQALPDSVSAGADGGNGGGGNGGGKIKSKGNRSCYSHRLSHRATPYSIPPPCDSSSAASGVVGDEKEKRRRQRWGRRRYPSTCMNNNAKKAATASEGPDDPLVMLQELISDGSLIKEAVRRLQLGSGRLTPNNGGGNNGSKASGKHTAAYDSDDEDCRTPPDQDVQFPCCEVGL